MVISDTNFYGLQRATLLDIKNKKTEELLFGSRYFFFSHNILVTQRTNHTIIRILEEQLEKTITGNFQYKPFVKEGKMIFYERKARQVVIVDNSLKEIASLENVEMVRFDEELPSVSFIIDKKIYSIDLKSMKKTKWGSADQVKWMGNLKSELITLQSMNGTYHIGRYAKNNVARSIPLDMPQRFYLDSLLLSSVELKNNRYLIIPLKKERLSKKEKNEIFYTHQNHNYKNPFSQMAVYDLKNEIWKRLPNVSDEFAQQQFIDNRETILYYDPSKDTLESFINARYEQSIELDFGGRKRKIDNVHALPENFYFDPISNTMIYYKDRRWRIESIMKNISREIPFERPEYFISEVYSGLSDRPSGKVYPTNLSSKYIITDEYDLFLVDVVHVTVKRLTFGREKEMVFSIPEPTGLGRTSDSHWDKEVNIKVDLSKKILLKALNKKDYSSQLCEYDVKKSELKIREETGNRIQDIYQVGNTIVYTMESYQKPLSVYTLQNGVSTLVYQSKGVDQQELVNLKKEIIRYEVNGKKYNAALLYPAHYKANTTYPLIFNIYERKSKDILMYQIPYLFDTQGFNIMHYVYQDYFVLLPDFDYEVENVGRSISKSVDAIVEKLTTNKNIDLNRMAGVRAFIWRV
ncbi:hypothetical protein [Chryseobacterium taiwanense]|nr:hypothetical protein [Chryseobacterium taiwanense]